MCIEFVEVKVIDFLVFSLVKINLNEKNIGYNNL